MICSGCAPIQPVEDQGRVRFRPRHHLIYAVFHEKQLATETEADDIVVSYHTKDELLSLMHSLYILPAEIVETTTISITGHGRDKSIGQWISLSQMKARMEHVNVVDIIQKGQFSSHMQPIVDSSEEIVGFEFLLRPAPNGVMFQPYQLFEIARETGMHSFLDRAARISAIETSAEWLPRGVKRFINFLPSSIYNPEYCLSHTFKTIDRLHLDPKDFVFEVVETEKLDSMDHLLQIFKAYRDHGMKVALDDVGSGYSTMEVMSMLKPDYVKIDRSIIDCCDRDAVKKDKILNIIDRAEKFGGQVLAEGIERREEFEFCRSSGIHLAQGYLFGKPAERPPFNVLQVV
ncbi:EAL domain-containing protein [Paenibacillus sp. KQZ6P-2]|uniref:EAL domain-containing protein n=1 Tax=Paenibacillus mangrovi TaxID=2931978 RepID=A0A9X2B2I5_9BACL|nr:EAL domain-containing protein [Paenibacillus mangrovi]MCJ8011985.1 EAL domain-containing protein [Paenibacillus mangrovi]